MTGILSTWKRRVTLSHFPWQRRKWWQAAVIFASWSVTVNTSPPKCALEPETVWPLQAGPKLDSSAGRLPGMPPRPSRGVGEDAAERTLLLQTLYRGPFKLKITLNSWRRKSDCPITTTSSRFFLVFNNWIWTEIHALDVSERMPNTEPASVHL